MKKISLDFTNRMLGIEISGQCGTERMPDHLTKSLLLQFLPTELLYAANCFTLDFENNSFIINKEIPLLNRNRGEILTINSFVPVSLIPVADLNDNYLPFCNALGYVECNFSDIFFPFFSLF